MPRWRAGRPGRHEQSGSRDPPSQSPLNHLPRRWTLYHLSVHARQASVSLQQEDVIMEIRTLDGSAASIADDVLAAFKAGFSGLVIVPGEGPYDEARRVWNSLIDRRPGLIAQ